MKNNVKRMQQPRVNVKQQKLIKNISKNTERKIFKEYEDAEEQLEEEIVIENNILCEICKKSFKTEGVFKSHCNSNKHKAKMAKLGVVSSYRHPLI